MGHLKMFRHYFFKYWNEENRVKLETTLCDLKARLIDDPTELYHKSVATGVVKQEMSSNIYYLCCIEDNEEQKTTVNSLINMSLGGDATPGRE